MKDIINNLKKSDAWNIHLTLAINFKDVDEEFLIHSKSDNIEIMTNDKAERNFLNHFFLNIKLT